MERRRVVVTGLGCISPIGNTVAAAWHNAAAGVSGIDYIQRFDISEQEVKFGGEVKGFDPEAVFGRRDARRMDRVTQLGLVAADEALKDSGLVVTSANHYDIACVIGTGIGGITSLFESIQAYIEKGPKGVSPLMVPMTLTDAISSRVSMTYGLRGPNFSISTACATGNNCIGEAAELIRRGQADAALAGSSEAGLVHVSLASFNNMTAISRRNDDPKGASRPFALGRDGFVVSEGAAVLMLEELGHALARGAKIYSEILGYGHTSDAHHVTAPLENGEGAAMAIRRALAHARLTPADLDYINAHGTSTPFNDKAETTAIKAALGEQAYSIPISSTKSVTGHLMGSAGSVEAVITIKAIEHGFVPPTINLHEPDPDCDLNYTPNVGVPHVIDVAMSNSFGFGGHNAVLIMGRYTDNGRHDAD